MEKEVSSGYILGIIIEITEVIFKFIRLVLMIYFGILISSNIYNRAFNCKLIIIPIIIVACNIAMSIIFNTINLKYNKQLYIRNIAVEVIRDAPNNITKTVIWLGIGMLVNGLYHLYMPTIAISSSMILLRFLYISNKKKVRHIESFE